MKELGYHMSTIWAISAYQDKYDAQWGGFAEQLSFLRKGHQESEEDKQEGKEGKEMPVLLCTPGQWEVFSSNGGYDQGSWSLNLCVMLSCALNVRDDKIIVIEIEYY